MNNNSNNSAHQLGNDHGNDRVPVNSLEGRRTEIRRIGRLCLCLEEVLGSGELLWTLKVAPDSGLIVVLTSEEQIFVKEVCGDVRALSLGFTRLGLRVELGGCNIGTELAVFVVEEIGSAALRVETGECWVTFQLQSNAIMEVERICVMLESLDARGVLCGADLSGNPLTEAGRLRVFQCASHVWRMFSEYGDVFTLDGPHSTMSWMRFVGELCTEFQSPSFQGCSVVFRNCALVGLDVEPAAIVRAMTQGLVRDVRRRIIVCLEFNDLTSNANADAAWIEALVAFLTSMPPELADLYSFGINNVQIFLDHERNVVARTKSGVPSSRPVQVLGVLEHDTIQPQQFQPKEPWLFRRNLDNNTDGYFHPSSGRWLYPHQPQRATGVRRRRKANVVIPVGVLTPSLLVPATSHSVVSLDPPIMVGVRCSVILVCGHAWWPFKTIDINEVISIPVGRELTVGDVTQSVIVKQRITDSGFLSENLLFTDANGFEVDSAQVIPNGEPLKLLFCCTTILESIEAPIVLRSDNGQEFKCVAAHPEFVLHLGSTVSEFFGNLQTSPDLQGKLHRFSEVLALGSRAFLALLCDWDRKAVRVIQEPIKKLIEEFLLLHEGHTWNLAQMSVSLVLPLVRTLRCLFGLCDQHGGGSQFDHVGITRVLFIALYGVYHIDSIVLCFALVVDWTERSCSDVAKNIFDASLFGVMPTLFACGLLGCAELKFGGQHGYRHLWTFARFHDSVGEYDDIWAAHGGVVEKVISVTVTMNRMMVDEKAAVYFRRQRNPTWREQRVFFSFGVPMSQCIAETMIPNADYLVNPKHFGMFWESVEEEVNLFTKVSSTRDKLIGLLSTGGANALATLKNRPIMLHILREVKERWGEMILPILSAVLTRVIRPEELGLDLLEALQDILRPLGPQQGVRHGKVVASPLESRPITILRHQGMPFFVARNNVMPEPADDVHVRRLRDRAASSNLRENPTIDNTGSCQFDSFADQLHLRGILNERDMHRVRRDICDWIEQNAASFVLPSGDTLANWIQDTQNLSIAQYLKQMRQGNTWGDDVTLIAAAERYGVEIRVLSSTEGVQFLQSYQPRNGQPRAVLHVGLILNLHYWSLIPIQRGGAEDCAAQQIIMPDASASLRVLTEERRTLWEGQERYVDEVLALSVARLQEMLGVPQNPAAFGLFRFDGVPLRRGSYIGAEISAVILRSIKGDPNDTIKGGLSDPIETNHSAIDTNVAASPISHRVFVFTLTKQVEELHSKFEIKSLEVKVKDVLEGAGVAAGGRKIFIRHQLSKRCIDDSCTLKNLVDQNRLSLESPFEFVLVGSESCAALQLPAVVLDGGAIEPGGEMTSWDCKSLGPSSWLSIACSCIVAAKPDLVYFAVGCANCPFERYSDRDNVHTQDNMASTTEQKIPTWLVEVHRSHPELKIEIVLVDPELSLQYTRKQLKNRLGENNVLCSYALAKTVLSEAERKACAEAGWDVSHAEDDPGPVVLKNGRNVRVWIIPEFFYSPLWSRFRGKKDFPDVLDSFKWRKFYDLLRQDDIALCFAVFHDVLLRFEHAHVLRIEGQSWQAGRRYDNFYFCDEWPDRNVMVIIDGRKVFLYRPLHQ